MGDIGRYDGDALRRASKLPGATLSCETVPVSAPENMSSQATVRCFNWLAEARNSSTVCEGNNPDNALYLAFDRSSQSFKTVPVPENSCFR